jgi:hypothetical protein
MGQKKEILSYHPIVLTCPNTFHWLTKVQKWVFEECGWVHYAACFDTQLWQYIYIYLNQHFIL